MATPYTDDWRVDAIILDAMGHGELVDQSAVYSQVKTMSVSYKAFITSWVRLALRGQIQRVGMSWRIVK